MTEHDPARVARADQVHRLCIDLVTGVWHSGRLYDDGRTADADRARDQIARRLSRMSESERAEILSMLLTMNAATMAGTGDERRRLAVTRSALERERTRMRRARAGLHVAALLCVAAAAYNAAVFLF